MIKIDLSQQFLRREGRVSLRGQFQQGGTQFATFWLDLLAIIDERPQEPFHFADQLLSRAVSVDCESTEEIPELPRTFDFGVLRDVRVCSQLLQNVPEEPKLCLLYTSPSPRD